MEIRSVIDSVQWDKIAEKFNGSYYCYYDWLSCDATYTMNQLELLGIYNNDTLVDTFPLLIDLKKNSARSCGCFDKNNFKAFIAFAESTFSLSLITVTSHHSDTCIEKAICINYLEMQTEISALHDVDSYLKQHSTVRKNYNKALNNGLSIKEETDCNNFYTFYCDMVKRNRVGYEFSFQWFECLLQKFSNYAGILTAFQEGIAVGSVFYFTTKNEIFNYFTVIDYAHRQLQAGTLLFVSLYRKAIERGIPQVNLGPDTCGSPTFEYKKKFGAIPQPLYTIQYTKRPLLRLQFQLINTIRQFVLKRPLVFSIVRRILKK